MILETYTRIFVPPDQFQSTLSFYTTLLHGTETSHFTLPTLGLELVTVSSPQLSVLIIAGSAEARAPFEETRLTIRVDDLSSMAEELKAIGVEQLEGVSKTPVGWKTRFRHTDGMVVEYVQHDKADSSSSTGSQSA